MGAFATKSPPERFYVPHRGPCLPPSSLSLAESRYANSANIVAGDFNLLDIKSLKKHVRLKQIVKKPTREERHT